ncbi:MAG: sucrose phosphorylase [Arenicella sp.]|jgi:sucrose phosphorylase
MQRLQKVVDHLSRIYPDHDQERLARRLLRRIGVKVGECTSEPFQNTWSQSDAWLISYADSVIEDQQAPLQTLKKFVDQRLRKAVSGVHILPFFPYSSDDGFSVINYVEVNQSFGNWDDIKAIAEDYDLMADLVINHCSARSVWFEKYKQGKHPGVDYFVEASADDDLSQVVRPRTSTLLKETPTLDGEKLVWCTFSHDQVDLNFANPDVLLEMVGIIRRYLEQGVRIFRLDAIAFLWKEIGTSCIHLPQTHEVTRLLRTLIEEHSPQAIIITETNVPNLENLSYFGNGNEAHAVYNFSLPPLVLHALVAGTSAYLKQWQMSMPPAQAGNFYFNFIASHDGIGLRPAEGLLSEEEISSLVATMENHGAKISWRSGESGDPRPYEINVALFDALKGTSKGPDQFQIDRFLCAHAIMFALEGVPGIYIHSLLGTQNDYQRFGLSNQNRCINRHRWDWDNLQQQLDDQDSHHYHVYRKMLALLALRRAQPAFHPNAAQYTLHLGDEVFAFWRQSLRRDQSIFCLHNVSDRAIEIPLNSVNLVGTDGWLDLISGDSVDAQKQMLSLSPYQAVWLSNRLFT